ncbi:SpvB/TcaC N-terminal domain-containing protein [Bradyrhizobium sp. CCBAU 11361]|uniref:SpvB/TcaC N-terminal domain-containing protein n=1 Tax=Bradyrhizobium sp. CCBAU 11361 TaxID=1630812 RepID=UPI0023064029|nr:SpvB/TcaC N-terminal domain-containing protein [Bradyrhizobium sp. CCBAU 11361]
MGRPPDVSEVGQLAASADAQSRIIPPTLTLPKSGGSIRGLGEKFAASSATGTGSMTVPLPLSPGRQGLSPSLQLVYDSGTGNSPFGFGWQLNLPSITRKTDKGLPRYDDVSESDVFILSNTEDLVPIEDDIPSQDTRWIIRRYRPRVERLFARIERWTNSHDPTDVHWRSISPDNVLTVYGDSPSCRICNPSENKAQQIFSWLVAWSIDDRGNAVLYRYKQENGDGVKLERPSEANRGQKNADLRKANRYIKSVHYGNRVPMLGDDGRRCQEFPETQQIESVISRNWLFQVVFDYGEHASEPPAVEETAEWTFRDDSFSSRRSGFEIRISRLCQRILMFHRFDELEVGKDTLVRSLTLTHDTGPDEAGPGYSLVRSVTQRGYRKQESKFVSADLPPLCFEYSEAKIDPLVRSISAETLENAAGGLGSNHRQWVDIDGSGIAGLLTEEAGLWLFQQNLSPLRHRSVELAPVRVVSNRPSHGILDGSLMDLEGDGRPDLVVLAAPITGFYENEVKTGWSSFRSFRHGLNRSLGNADVNFIDLDGDGRADILVAEDNKLTWYPSLGEDGFDEALAVDIPLDGEMGPCVLKRSEFASTHFADMTGDGLSDLVRVTAREVCYWPNLGYGRFGPKVTMDNSPPLDLDGGFKPDRVILCDIDGSGTSDLVHLTTSGLRTYFNRSGNAWSGSDEPTVPGLRANNLGSVAPIDLFGNGTTCLVWSSELDHEPLGSMRYVDLMGGAKPHLLTKVTNGMGSETEISYASSTRFFLEDQRSGRGWSTSLPFPVHVVSRIVNREHVTGSRFVSRFAYHDGYFDPFEREFRGFGMVEQWDTEDYPTAESETDQKRAPDERAASFVPPVHTKSWFHTGHANVVDRGPETLSDAVSATRTADWYREPAHEESAAARMLPAAPPLPAGLDQKGRREACRALRGLLLRQEVYADDKSDRAKVPYLVTTHTYAVRTIERPAVKRYGIFMNSISETLTLHYDRDTSDPRASHRIVIETDDYGNVLKACDIAYGRRARIWRQDEGAWREVPNPGFDRMSDWDIGRQRAARIIYSEQKYTDPLSGELSYRGPIECEARRYEIFEFAPSASSGRYEASDFRWPATGELGYLPDLDYSERNGAAKQRRLIEMRRTLFRNDVLSGYLPLGHSGELALVGESYRLTLTGKLASSVYVRSNEGREPEALLPDAEAILCSIGTGGAGYVSSGSMKRLGLFPADDDDQLFWEHSGRCFFSPCPEDSAGEELSFARSHFFQIHRWTDAFGATSVATLDDHVLLTTRVTNPVGNSVQAIHDYRVLLPSSVSDANGNRAEVRFDALGLVVATIVCGKDATEGDSFQVFRDDLSFREVRDFLSSPDPTELARNFLGTASTRLIYDFSQVPAVMASIAREIHAPDPDGSATPLQLSFSYFDGLGREAGSKSQAEPGPVPERDSSGAIVLGPLGLPRMGTSIVARRWTAQGWIVRNNKGETVRRYEPWFSNTHRFEPRQRVGVSAVLFFDPVGRAIGTLSPDHSWTKVEYTAWKTTLHDSVDTLVAGDGSDCVNDPVLGAHFERLQRNEYTPAWYALRTDPAYATEFDKLYASAEERLRQTQAAEQAMSLAGTPTVHHLDSMGRIFLSLSDLGGPPGTEHRRLPHRVELDIEGNTLTARDSLTTTKDVTGKETFDPLGRVVERSLYDMLGNRLRQISIEAGEHWTVRDIAGNPLISWTGRGHRERSEYDAMRRLVRKLVADDDSANHAREVVIERTIYGEEAPDHVKNLRDRVWVHLDQSGITVNEQFDFKGNLTHSRRRLVARSGYRSTVDWSRAPIAGAAVEDNVAALLEEASWSSSQLYDALNRVVQYVPPYRDGDAISAVGKDYNEANLLRRTRVWLNLRAVPLQRLKEAPTMVPIRDIVYDAKGQKLVVEFGSGYGPGRKGLTAQYRYDPLTFRTTEISASRDVELVPSGQQAGGEGAGQRRGLQRLRYTYDPAGNISHIADDAQQAIFFRNRRVEAGARYSYDALYRLVEASGREHIGLARAGSRSAKPYDWDDGVGDGSLGGGTLLPSDGTALASYRETYSYDDASNLVEMRHSSSDSRVAGWTRKFEYSEHSAIDEPVSKPSNRLSASTVGSLRVSYNYDPNGNLLAMPHLQEMLWNHRDELQMSRRQAVGQSIGERTFYVYDAAGTRTRKVTEFGDGRLKNERLYFGDLEVYCQHSGPTAGLERRTLHIHLGDDRVASIEIRNAVDDGSPQRLVRYTLSDHLGSNRVELDELARVISYEEYTPYGSTSYRAPRHKGSAPSRYRFNGKERDDETGLYYYGDRYYAPWLARWISCDPEGVEETHNLYLYVRANPVRNADPSGGGFLDKVKASATNALARAEAAVKPGGSVFEAVDNAFNPQKNEVSAGVLNNLANRGEAMVQGTIKEVKQAGNDVGDVAYYSTHPTEAGAIKKLSAATDGLAKQIPGASAQPYIDKATTFANQVETVGKALGDIAYYAKNNNEHGANGKIASAITDIAIDGPQIALTIEGAARGVKGLAPKPGLKSKVKVMPAAKEIAARDLKAPRGTAKNPIPVHELKTYKIKVDGRNYPPAVVEDMQQRMQGYYGKDMHQGRSKTPGTTFQVGHADTPQVFAKDGTEVRVRAELTEMNRASSGSIRKEAARVRKLNKVLPPDKQIYVRPPQ